MPNIGSGIERERRSFQTKPSKSKALVFEVTMENWAPNVRRGTSALAHLKYILAAMQFYGMGPFEPTKLNSQIKTPRRSLFNLSARSIVPWIVSVFCFVRLLMKLFLTFAGAGKVGEAAVGLLRGFASLTALTRFLVYRRHLCQFFYRLDKIDDSVIPSTKLRFYTSAYTLTIWVYILVRIVADLVELFVPGNLSKYVQDELALRAVPRSLESVFYFIGFADKLILRISISGTTTFLISSFSQLAWLVAHKFRAFDVALKKYCATERGVGLAGLRHLRMQHAQISLLVQDMENIYSPVTLMWHAMMVLGCCGEATHLLQLKASEHVIVKTQISLDLFYLISLLILVSHAGAAVCEGHSSSLLEVNRLAATDPNAEDPEFSAQAFLLMSQMQATDVSLTAWKFYDLNRAALITTGGATATYVAIVLQMAPSFLEDVPD